jgi:hypothetical protein
LKNPKTGVEKKKYGVFFKKNLGLAKLFFHVFALFLWNFEGLAKLHGRGVKFGQTI